MKHPMNIDIKSLIGAFAVALSACLLVFFLAHFSAHLHGWFYDDSALNHDGSMLYRMGIWITGVLVYALGGAVWILAPLLFLMAWCRAFDCVKEYRDRMIGLVVMLISCAGWCAFIAADLYAHGAPGGALGRIIHSLLLKMRSPVLEYGVLVATMWLSLVLVLRYAWARPLCRAAIALASFLKIRAVYYWTHGCSQWLRVRLERIKSKVYRVRVENDEDLETSVRDIVDSVDASADAFASASLIKQDTDELYTDPIWKQLSILTQDPQEVPGETLTSEPVTPCTASQDVPDIEPVKPYQKPDISLLNKPTKESKRDDAGAAQRARILEQKLENFGINGAVVSVTVGPLVTLFEYQPRIDTKISSILAREDDLALALQAMSLRIIAPIPGTSVVGFEVANASRASVLFSEVLMSSAWHESKRVLPLVLGADVVGAPCIIDLARLPHLLVAGSTGSGKSVALHTMLMSLLFALSPDKLKLILIDPKRIEFSAYSDLPHLMFPIATQAPMIMSILQWVVGMMEERYGVMAAQGVRNIEEYHALYSASEMPFVVVMIDEFADLMMTSGKQVEVLITRLAQMARAAGIHLIIATQRPSVDVITGLIKVNFPARIALKVTSKIDSRTILDSSGAEKLLGKGDLLLLDEQGAIRRAHGTYVSRDEIQRTVDFIKSQQRAEYVVLTHASEGACDDDEDSALLAEVRGFLREVDEVSISLVQRTFRIGYNRSARIIEKLEREGIIASPDGGKMRRVIRESKEQSS